MDLKSLTNTELISVGEEYRSKEEVIRDLVSKLYREGKISSEKKFYKEVLKREALGATGLGMGLAVPHAKSKAVRQASFAVALTKNPLSGWESIEEGDKISLVILIAVPDRGGADKQVDLLSQLTGKLVGEEFIKEILECKSPEDVMKKFSEGEGVEEVGGIGDESKKNIVCVTACPAGVAHTYIAAESLRRAGARLGVNIKIEMQGANGVEGRISDSDISAADAAIFAVDVAVKEGKRFEGIPRIEVSVSEPLKRADELIEEAIQLAKESPKDKTVAKTLKKEDTGKITFKKEVKRAMLTGISYIVPIIVAGGTVLAVTVLITQIFGLQEIYETENSWLWLYRKLGSGLLSTLMVPVLSAYIAFSLAEKPGLGPGFAAGVAANLINGGFIGGIVGGFVAGYTLKWIKGNIKVPEALKAFFTFYLYPVLGTFIAASIMLFVVGRPVVALNQGMTEWLNKLSGGNAILLGAIIGSMVSFDLGGPVNKAAYAFCIGAMANGNYMPYAAFASVKMVSAFTATVSTRIFPQYYLAEEIEAGKSTWILGLAGITEGAIPMIIEDPFRVIPSFIAGSAVTGALVAFFKLGLNVPGAGIVSMLVLQPHQSISKLTSAGIWFGSAIVGTIISTVILTYLKREKYKDESSRVQLEIEKRLEDAL